MGNLIWGQSLNRNPAKAQPCELGRRDWLGTGLVPCPRDLAPSEVPTRISPKGFDLLSRLQSPRDSVGIRPIHIQSPRHRKIFGLMRMAIDDLDFSLCPQRADCASRKGVRASDDSILWR